MDTNVRPKVSVLMPVYNAALFLQEAIDSILSQTFTDFEFLIINDGSTDASEEIIQGYSDSRILYLKNEVNLGLVDTLNRGIELARGEYIARMDADDVSLPQRFFKQITFMDAHPEVGACGTAFQFFGDSNYLAINPDDYSQCFTLLSLNSSLGHPTSMIRKEVLNHHAIRYESEFDYAADYAFWVRISQVSQISSLPEPLLLYRWHQTNMSKTDPSRAMARIKARILWHELLLGRSLSAPQKEYLAWNFGSRKTFRAGKELLSSVLESSRIDKEYYRRLAVTEWELKLIDHFGLRGLLTCFMQPDFRRNSRATAIGLVAHYLGRFGIRLKHRE